MTRRRLVRLVVGGALVAAVVGLAAVLAYRELRPHAPTVHGSTTREFSPVRKPAPTGPPTTTTHDASLDAVPWPTYGYDQQRLRAAAGIRLRPPFRRLWTFHGRTLLEFPPVVGYGRVYLSTFTGNLYALDAATGKPVWRYGSGRCGWSSPALSDRVVYATFIGSPECTSTRRDGLVVAFDAASGRIRWRRSIGPTESSPLVGDGAVYVGDWNGVIWSLDAVTGRTHWRFETGGAVKGSVSLSAGRLYIGNYDGALYCLDARTGREVWRSGGHGSFYSSPAVAYGRVFLGSLDGGVYAFGASTGHLLWSHPTGGYVYASAAVWSRLILIGSYDHTFYALDAGTGDTRWRFRADGPISGSASVIGGLVYFSTFDETTYALLATTGAEVIRWPDGKYSPAVADAHHLYLVGLGRLYALAPRA